MEIPRPAPRPADAKLAELVVTTITGIQAGLLLDIGLRGWGDPGIGGGPVPGVLAILGIGVLAGWILWIVGRGGWLLAAASVPVALIAGLLVLAGPVLGSVAGLDLLVQLFILAAACIAITQGLRLPAPSHPRRVPVGGATPAQASPITGSIEGAGARVSGIAAILGDRLRRERGPRRPGTTRRGGRRGPPTGPELPPVRTTSTSVGADAAATPGNAAQSAPRPGTGSRFLGPARSTEGMELPLDAQPARPASALARPFADVPDAPASAPREGAGVPPRPSVPPARPIAPPPAAPERPPAAVPDDPFRDLFAGPPGRPSGGPPAP